MSTDIAPYLTAPILRDAVARARTLTDEIVRATALSRLLAPLAGLLPSGAERDALFYEALELAFLNPFFPERGGDGAPDEPQAVHLSPEYVKQLLSQLSPADQLAVLRDHLAVIGTRMGGSATQVANVELGRLDRNRSSLLASDTVLEQNEVTATLFQSPTVVVTQGQAAKRAESSGLPLAAATPRYLQSRFPTCVRLRDRVPLQVRVAREVGNETSSLLRDFSVPAAGAELTLVLHAPNFAIESERTQCLHLPANGDSDWALWEVEPLQAGRFALSVTAYNGAAYLGEILFWAEVSISGRVNAEREQNCPLVNRVTQVGEATLSVRYDADSKFSHTNYGFRKRM